MDGSETENAVQLSPQRIALTLGPRKYDRQTIRSELNKNECNSIYPLCRHYKIDIPLSDATTVSVD